MQEPPRFEAPQLDPKIPGSVRDVLTASAAAAHEASLKSSEERGPEWSRRREEMERNQTVIERIPSAHPTRKHELSILTVNFGNMLRSGQTPHSAEHCNTLLAKFLLGDHSQIVLVQESTSLQRGSSFAFASYKKGECGGTHVCTSHAGAVAQACINSITTFYKHHAAQNTQHEPMLTFLFYLAYPSVASNTGDAKIRNDVYERHDCYVVALRPCQRSRQCR